MNQAGSVAKLALPAFSILALILISGIYSISRPVSAPSCASALIALNGQTMGTHYRIQLPEQALAEQEIRASLEQNIHERLQYLDKTLMSTYEADSQLSLLNEARQGQAFSIAPELAEVLESAFIVHQNSGGAFDISVKPLVELWGFGASAPLKGIPDADAIELAKAEMGMNSVLLNVEWEGEGKGYTVLKSKNVSLDLSAIAKGYAVDQVALLLENTGLHDYLVEIGGETISKGRKPDGSSWRLGIESPVENEPSLFQPIRLGPEKRGVASSGNYRNYFVFEETRYSHTINPVTGRPVTHNLVSVTVINDTTVMADAWATALLVLGAEEGMKLANELQLAAYFIIAEKDGLEGQASDAFSPYL